MPMHQPQWHSTNSDKTHHELTPVEGMTLTAESRDDFQVSHDAIGSLVGGQNGGHNSVQPHLDIHDEIRQDFVLAIAEKLKQACQKNEFNRLVIAASPKVLGLLRQHMSTDVVARVIAEIPRDFTHEPTDILLAHLQETLTKAHVA